MSAFVSLQKVQPRIIAAVRREVMPGALSSTWKPALDKVWDFIRAQPALRSDGHNLFLYYHPTKPGAPTICNFGVEITRIFEPEGEVYAMQTPGGEAAVADHYGPYSQLDVTHDAIKKWMATNERESAGCSWEVYGDPTPDPANTQTTVMYLLK